ncbi:hypothetical protein Taro_019713 [Colocasia esculenta]|uniref:Uncharacterized protein n=1 Tax=Colocasia esculenta TaxID=4460 RepID=A0A843V311_COLES|nr:hypothetical protein [Colocasia esculenta]
MNSKNPKCTTNILRCAGEQRGVARSPSHRCRTGERGVALEQHGVARSPLHTASPSTSAASTSTVPRPRPQAGWRGGDIFFRPQVIAGFRHCRRNPAADGGFRR